MGLYEDLCCKKEKVIVIGLGYVGIPLAIEFAQKTTTIGFDIDKNKIALYKRGIDSTDEVGNEAISKTSLVFTDDEKSIEDASFIIITVPTPIYLDKRPDLNPVIEASKMVGRHIKKGSIVVYESTVYPGVTEDICIPILCQESGLTIGKDFFVGYSPERINPGDKTHRVKNIPKIVSGIDAYTCKEIAKVYKLVIEADIFEADSIKVAEAAKIAENAQRDINIAFMNELAMIFDHMNINTKEVINAMNTKWNALNFHPGLVGGHCIGVDPYYFIYEAEKLGYSSQIISAGRKINDDMSKFLVETIIKQLIRADINIKTANVYIMGITFKENCKDLRNSKVMDIINQLNGYNIKPLICDPVADAAEVYKTFNQQMVEIEKVHEADCIIFAVAHDQFKKLSLVDVGKMYQQAETKPKVIIDIKSMFNKNEAEYLGFQYWNL